MTYIITPTEMPTLELFPDDEETEILQNIYCIIQSMEGTCPNLRGFGIDPDVLGKPLSVAKAAYTVSLMAQFELFETRATLQNVSFADDPENPDKLIPVLEVTIP